MAHGCRRRAQVVRRAGVWQSLLLLLILVLIGGALSLLWFGRVP